MPKKKQQAEEPDSFWVSYSDLATGLMIVFMLVMIITWSSSKNNQMKYKQTNFQNWSKSWK